MMISKSSGNTVLVGLFAVLFTSSAAFAQSVEEFRGVDDTEEATEKKSGEPAAAEQPRVIIVDVRGTTDSRSSSSPSSSAEARGSIVLQQITAALAQYYDLYGQKDWNRIAERLETSAEVSTASASRIAPEMRAHAVVEGTIAKRGKRATLTVRDGTTGRRIETQRFTVGDAGIPAIELGRMSGFLARAIAKGKAGEPTLPPELPPELFAEEKALGASDPSSDGEAADTVNGPPLQAKREASAIPAPAKERTRSVLDARLALGLTSRSFSYGSNAALLRNYDSALVPSFAIGLEGYPLGLFSHGWVANIGLALAYQQMLTLKSTLGGTDLTYSSSQREVAVGARYRHALKGTAFRLKGMLDWHRVSFSTDWEGQPALVPNATHSLLRFGVLADYSFRRLPIRADLGFAYLRALGSSGDLNAGGGNGIELQAGAAWLLLDKRALGVGPRVRLIRFGLADPDTSVEGVSSSSATEQHLSLWLDATYAY